MACQATCLVQSLDIWSNVTAKWSIWSALRVCRPDTRLFACFGACDRLCVFASCVYMLWFLFFLDCIMRVLSNAM